MWGDMAFEQDDLPQLRLFNRIEIIASCIAWPGIAVVCGLLLYWLWLDPKEGAVGAPVIAASTVFLVLLVAAVICTINAWLEFGSDIPKRRREASHGRADIPPRSQPS